MVINDEHTGSDHTTVAARAEQLVNTSRTDRALVLLDRLLADRDPAETPPDVGLADAAVIYARIRDEAARAAYARDASVRLRGPLHPSTGHALMVLADVYARRADGDRAAQTYQRAAGVFEQLAVPADALHARIRLAVCWHRLGRCQQAIDLAAGCWRTYCDTPTTPFVTGGVVAATYLAMLRQCQWESRERAVETDAFHRLPLMARPGSGRSTRTSDAVLNVSHESVCSRGCAHISAGRRRTTMGSSG
jgi:hypothetical protein